MQAHHAPVRAALRERGGALHPEVVLARELRQVFPYTPSPSRAAIRLTIAAKKKAAASG